MRQLRVAFFGSSRSLQIPFCHCRIMGNDLLEERIADRGPVNAGSSPKIFELHQGSDRLKDERF